MSDAAIPVLRLAAPRVMGWPVVQLALAAALLLLLAGRVWPSLIVYPDSLVVPFKDAIASV